LKSSKPRSKQSSSKPDTKKTKTCAKWRFMICSTEKCWSLKILS
jgi:hypothetical protein